MSSNIDFKALWQQQQIAAKPSASEIIKKAKAVRRKTINKLLLLNVVLIATMLLYVFMPGTWTQNTMLTTKIGAGLVILAIVFFLTVSNKLLAHLFKSNPEADTFAYLSVLLTLRKRQDYIQTKAMDIYMLFLSAGVFLYMVEYTGKMGVIGACIAYAVLTALLGMVYFYLKPRSIKKQRAELNAAIEKLQAINDQLAETKDVE